MRGMSLRRPLCMKRWSMHNSGAMESCSSRCCWTSAPIRTHGITKERHRCTTRSQVVARQSRRFSMPEPTRERGTKTERRLCTWRPPGPGPPRSFRRSWMQELIRKHGTTRAKHLCTRRPGFSRTSPVVTALADAGADLEARNGKGWTPLHFAAAFGTSPSVVAALLDAGADPEARTGNRRKSLGPHSGRLSSQGNCRVPAA